MNEEQLTTGGLIATIIGAITGAGWIGNVLVQYLKNKGGNRLALLQDEVDDLTKEKARVLKDCKALKNERDKYKALLKQERNDKMMIHQKLASIQIAFNVTYRHLREKVGPDDPILPEVKKYIDEGTGNVT